jgi:hypothetical protein
VRTLSADAATVGSAAGGGNGNINTKIMSALGDLSAVDTQGPDEDDLAPAPIGNTSALGQAQQPPQSFAGATATATAAQHPTAVLGVVVGKDVGGGAGSVQPAATATPVPPSAPTVTATPVKRRTASEIFSALTSSSKTSAASSSSSSSLATSGNGAAGSISPPVATGIVVSISTGPSSEAASAEESGSASLDSATNRADLESSPRSDAELNFSDKDIEYMILSPDDPISGADGDGGSGSGADYQKLDSLEAPAAVEAATRRLHQLVDFIFKEEPGGRPPVSQDPLTDAAAAILDMALSPMSAAFSSVVEVATAAVDSLLTPDKATIKDNAATATAEESATSLDSNAEGGDAAATVVVAEDAKAIGMHKGKFVALSAVMTPRVLIWDVATWDAVFGTKTTRDLFLQVLDEKRGSHARLDGESFAALATAMNVSMCQRVLYSKSSYC